MFRRFFVIKAREHACMSGVHFKPEAVFPFFLEKTLWGLEQAPG
jgi:hypothetical protein